LRLAVVQHRCRADAAEDAAELARAAEAAVAAGANAIVLPEVVAPVTVQGLEQFGRVVVVAGDAAIDPEQHRRLAADAPDVLVLAPGSESDLQAEAVVELAIRLSVSVAGLVIVVETSGAEPGSPGHGGSVVVLLGEVLAEAVFEEQTLDVDVTLPVPAPEPRAPLPELPTILAQRLAHHRGERPVVGYLADLS
jgi:hypothetical protein